MHNSYHPGGEERANEYASSKGMQIVGILGWGQDGIVYDTDDESAIKVLTHPEPYVHERDAYLRLKKHHVTSINGFAVPKLIDYDI
jgi:hypothetical protein